MSTRRFEVKVVPESNHPVQTSEIIPLIHVENEIPPPPPLPLPASLTSTNGNRVSSRALNAIAQNKSLNIRRRATITAAMALMSNKIKKSSSVDIFPTIDTISTHKESENRIDESDVYSTTQSNNYDTNPSGLTNQFLQELRSKRREFRDNAKNISIDQRIAFHRRANPRVILRAQDIFAVHFALQDDEENNLPTTQMNLFTEESQEKIRKDIFNELDRQRNKQHYKQHRHLLLGRSLLALMTLLLIFMGLTLIYVMIDLYDRAHHLDAKLPENEFLAMIKDKTTNLY